MTWSIPTKKIYDGTDITRFQRSLAYKKLHQTLAFVVEKVKGLDVPEGVLDASIVTRPKNNIPPPKTPAKIPEETKSSSLIELTAPKQEKTLVPADKPSSVLAILAELNTYIDETPPIPGPRRFGNFACREWHTKLELNTQRLCHAHLPLAGIEDQNGFITEIKYYLDNAFGSEVRLDYGTGHELSFLAFMGGLFDTKVIEDIDGVEILRIFAKYYDLCRKLILTYSLEPAGSHGVWGLDDHFHLAYILGAAQFNGDNHKRMVPPVLLVLSTQTLATYKTSNLYVNAVAFIHRIKLGPFNEHSPIISDIHHTVTLWSKVLSGLLKMYEVEVLGKFPVVQHFWFGLELYPWRDFATNEELPVIQKEDDPGLINQYQGVKTTRANISMTGAPWARR